MSKSAKIIVLIVVVAVLCTALVFGITFGNNILMAFENRNQVQNNAGAVSQTSFNTDSQGVQNINLDFTSEDIYVVATNDSKIRLEETSRMPINQNEMMQCSANGGTVQAVSGLRNNWFNFLNWGNYVEIKVTVYVPAAYQNNIDVHSISGVIDAQNLKVNGLKLNTTSGEISANNIQAASIQAGSTSGEMSLRNIQSNDIDMGETSGAISMSGSSFDTVSAHSVSGEIMLDAQHMDKINANSTSGQVSISAAEMPSQIKAGTVSGEVTLKLPENDGFKLNFHSVSGDVNNDFAMANGVYKNGQNNIEVGTTSGGLNIIKK